MPAERRLKTILLVEDDPEIRASMSDILEQHGYYVRTAANGVEALEQLRESGSITIILLDLMMPRMNGFEFRERQLQDPTLATLPVIVITAYGQMAEKVAALGQVPCLRKPVDYQELIALIERLTT
ncbi:MAG TPA: response regulator [Polyangia bacterium]